MNIVNIILLLQDVNVRSKYYNLNLCLFCLYYVSLLFHIINDYIIPYTIAKDPCEGKKCGEMCVVESDMAGGRCNGDGQCSFDYKGLGCGKISQSIRKPLL